MTKLVFLHGSGADKNAYFETMQNIASKFNAQLITFNAPFPHPNKKEKFVWFNKKEINGRRDAVEEEYFRSLQYVKERLPGTEPEPMLPDFEFLRTAEITSPHSSASRQHS